MCKKYSLRQIYVHDTFIYHKVNQSSEMSFHNDVNVKIITEGKVMVIWFGG